MLKRKEKSIKNKYYNIAQYQANSKTLNVYSTPTLHVLSPLPHLHNTVLLQLRASDGALLTIGRAPIRPV